MARSTQREQTGATGVSDAMSALQRIGWAPAKNDPDHDNGIDLFVQVRDARRYEVSLIAAQVKGGESWFSEPSKTGEPGWWFRDKDRQHLDDWVGYPVPVLLLLVDEASRDCYWVHVTKDAVVGTGKGAKILVPKAQLVVREQLPALLEAAATGRSAPEWEGSVWRTDDVMPAAQWRYALIAPRVVAPHPNAGPVSPIFPAQAAALLMQARVSELDEFGRSFDSVPSRSECLEHDKWQWRLVGAFSALLIQRQLDPLLNVQGEAEDATGRAVSTVAAAAALMSRQRADEALALVYEALVHDDSSPQDHAWLMIQRARLEVEVGKIPEARQAALEVLQARVVSPDDVTVAACAGAAAQLLFATAPSAKSGLEQAITQGDSAAAWWRGQTIVSGLSALQDREWRRWAPISGERRFEPDTANDKLVAALLSASHAGDQGATCRAASRLARDGLMRVDRFDEPGGVRRTLLALVGSGDAGAVKRATRRLVDDGPWRSVSELLELVDFDTSTRSTIGAKLALTIHGASAASEGAVARLFDRALALEANPDALASRTTANVPWLVEQTLGLLANSAALIEPEDQARLVERILRLDLPDDALIVEDWARVTCNLPASAWSADADKAFEVGRKAPRGLGSALLGAASSAGHTGARKELERLAREGSAIALGQLGDVDGIEDEVLHSWVGRYSDFSKTLIEDARRGMHTYGPSPIRDLVVLNLRLPASADWGTVVGALESEKVSASSKTPALEMLAARPSAIPEVVAGQLESVLKQLASRVVSDPDVKAGIAASCVPSATAAAVASGALGEAEALLALSGSLVGTPVERTAVARASDAFGPFSGVDGVLAALIRDPSPSVRGAAAVTLARRLEVGHVNADFASPLLVDALTDPGLLVPRNLAAVVQGAKTDALGATKAALANHSAKVVRSQLAALRRRVALRPRQTVASRKSRSMARRTGELPCALISMTAETVQLCLEETSPS